MAYIPANSHEPFKNRTGLIELRTLALVLGMTLLPFGSEASERWRGLRGDATTSKLTMATLVIENAGPHDLACDVQLAHWHSLTLATLSRSASLQLDLWFDPVSATYFYLNTEQDGIPVEVVWCGIVGRRHQTRAQVPLERDLGVSHTPAKITCTSGAEEVRCRR
jgi:hypothetical protein